MLRKYFEQFDWFLKHYKKEYIIAIIFILLNYFLDLQPARIVGSLSDKIIAKTIDIPTLSYWLLALLAMIAVNYVAKFIWGYYIYRASDDAGLLAHRFIFERLLKQTPAFFARNSTGSIMGKATNDVSAVGDFVGFGCMALFDATVWPIALFTIMSTLSWRLTVLSALPLPLLVIFSKRIGLKLYAFYDEAQEAFDDMNQSVLEGVAGIRVVRAYNLERDEKKNFAESADKLYRKNMKAVAYSILYGPMSRLIPGLSFVIALAVGIGEINAGRMTTGDLISFSFYLNMLVWPMISIGEFINTGQQGSASMERIDNLMKEPIEVTDKPDAVQMPEHMSIEARNLSFNYPLTESTTPALDGISFRLEEGRTLGVVGPVGSGKTTLLRQLLHFYVLPEGQLFIGGTDVADIERKSLREAIAYVPQQSFLFSRSIRENILLGASDADYASGEAEKRLEKVLDWADLYKDIPQLPHGLESQAGEKGIALSGGQKQRICIARALMKDAPILILDDCLSAVDAITEEHILTALRRERAGKTTLIAAHRLSAVRHSDLILVLDEGHLTDAGTHDELVARGGWYAEQFEQQQLEHSKRKEAV